MPTPSGVIRYGRRDGRRLQDVFQLPAHAVYVAEARRRVRSVLRLWGITEEICDDAVLTVSELFTNAVRHTYSNLVTCELSALGDLLRVEVSDESMGTTGPHVRETDPQDEAGRGLLLVSAVSHDWGVRPGENGRGRVVWAELPFFKDSR